MAVLTRLAQGTAPAISVALFSADEPLTGQTVTLDLFRADGTQLLDGAATTESSGVYVKTLTATETGEIDRLRAVWSWGSESTTSYHDVVGSHYCSLAALRETDPLDQTATYTDEQLVVARDLAAYALERETRGFAWTLRYGEHEFEGDGTATAVIPALGIRELRSLTIDDTAVDLDLVKLRPGGILRYASGFTSEALVRVGFAYAGELAPDGRVERANRLLAAQVLFSDALDGGGSAIPQRATSYSNEMGTFAVVTPGVGDAAFEIPEVNAVVRSYRVWRY